METPEQGVIGTTEGNGRAAIAFSGRLDRRAAFIFLAALLAGAPAASVQAAEPDPALVDAIVRKIEADGILDRAVERSLVRLSERRQEAQRSAQAEVSLIEYSDFECPYCKRFHGTPASVLERHDGRVNWVYRHFPLGFHNPAARREAVASECAAKLGGNELFWKYTDALFASTRSNGQGLPEGKSEAGIAAELGLKPEAFSRCLEDPQMAQRVDDDLADGTAAGVSGTPATVVRNNRSGASEWVVGAQPAEALEAAIRRVLGAKP